MAKRQRLCGCICCLVFIFTRLYALLPPLLPFPLHPASASSTSTSTASPSPTQSCTSSPTPTLTGVYLWPVGRHIVAFVACVWIAVSCLFANSDGCASYADINVPEHRPHVCPALTAVTISGSPSSTPSPSPSGVIGSCWGFFFAGQYASVIDVSGWLL